MRLETPTFPLSGQARVGPEWLQWARPGVDAAVSRIPVPSTLDWTEFLFDTSGPRRPVASLSRHGQGLLAKLLLAVIAAPDWSIGSAERPRPEIVVAPTAALGGHAGEVKATFERLSAAWRDDADTTSNLREVLMHPAHLQIIGLGRDALPFIFDDLRQGGGPWFAALSAITRESPVDPSHRMNAKAIRADWLVWGRRHGYVQT